MERNMLDTRVSVLVNPSNQPCEDRFNCAQLKNLDGFYSGVFDGHGGWQVSELAMRRLHVILDEQLAKFGSGPKTDDQISQAITQAFDIFEKEWVETARASFNGGFAKAAYVGSCALISVVHNNKLFVANAGDSKAALLRRNPDGVGFERVKVSKTFNANKKYE